MADNESETETRAESEQLAIVEEIPDNTDDTTTSGCNPVFVNLFTYVGALVTMIIISEIPGLPALPFPINKSMVVSNDTEFADNILIQDLFISLWGIHFLRRTVEVIFVHRYKRRMPIGECIGAPVYYWVFAVWIAWSMRHQSGYKNPHMVIVVAGTVVFFLGEAGNLTSHIQLRNFRLEKRASHISNTSTQHVIPHGFMFNSVACPHYMFEIVAWVGFFIASLTLASLVFLLASFVTLFVYSRKKHQAYKREFDGNDGRALYPADRKALIPYLL